MTIAEQMALDKDVRTLLTETKAGDKITESADYQTVFHEMEKIAAADSDNIQAVWLGDIDANVVTQSDGFTRTRVLKLQSVPGIVQWRRTVRS